jgi:hypothetical protein
MFKIAVLQMEPHLNTQGFIAFQAFGLAFLIFAIFSFLKGTQKRFYGWWPSIFRPLIMILCAMAIVVAVMFATDKRLPPGDRTAASFFIVFPSVLLATLFFLGSRRRGDSSELDMSGVSSSSHPGLVHAWLSNFSLFALIGWAVLICVFVVGLLTTIDLPGMINAGVMDHRLARDISRSFGFTHWPALMERIGYIVTFAGTFVAATFIVAGRRGASALHQLRAAIGAAGLLVGLSVLKSALRGQWPPINWVSGDAPNSSPAQMINDYLEAARPSMAILAAAALAVSMMILLWRKPSAQVHAIKMQEVIS